MRDILFKNLTANNHHKRDIFLSEDFEQNGVITKTEKHFIYLIRDHTVLNSPEELEAWLKEHVDKGPRLKGLSVLKKYDSKIGEERFEVKIEGNLYVLREQDIFSVEFNQLFMIDRRGENLKGIKHS